MHSVLSFILAFVGFGAIGHLSPKNGISQEDWSQTTKVVYRFGDSSVAPDYHRSYTITVTKSIVSISIDSYGDVLLTWEYPFSPVKFKTFIEKLSQSGMKKRKMKDDEGCAGGRTESIRLYKQQEKFFDAYVYHCAGESGDLYLPAGTSSLFTSLIP